MTDLRTQDHVAVSLPKRGQDAAWMSDYLTTMEGAGQEWHERIQAISDYIKESQQLEGQIKDLKRQLEAERSARVWHTQDSVDASKLLAAREMDLSEQETLIRQKLGRARKISINRLRRAKKAEAELAQMRAQRNGALQRLDMAEAGLRSEKRTVAELREALMRAVDAKETYAASWRIQAEEWEAKYKDAIETEGKKWEHAVTTWQTRYEDALKRIDRLKAEARGAGASND